MPYSVLRRKVAGMHLLGGNPVGIAIGELDFHGSNHAQLSADGVVGNGRDAQDGQIAVTGHANRLHPSRRGIGESIGGIESTVEDKGQGTHVRLAGRRLDRHHIVGGNGQLLGSDFRHRNNHLGAQRYFYHFRKDGKVGKTQLGGWCGAIESELEECLAANLLQRRMKFRSGEEYFGSRIVIFCHPHRLCRQGKPRKHEKSTNGCDKDFFHITIRKH